MIKTNFVAYDRYRADCTRWAFVRRSDPDWSSTASSLKMHNEDEELYMEFGEPYRIEHSLPEDLLTRDGLVVEVQLYVYLSKDRIPIGGTGYRVYPFNVNDLSLGISDRAASGAITYENRPDVSYFSGGNIGTRFLLHDMDHENGVIGENPSELSPARADLYSASKSYPARVEESIRNGALWLKIETKGGISNNEFHTVIANMSGSYAAYVEILYGYIEIGREIVFPKNGYVSPYEEQSFKWNWHYAAGQMWPDMNIIGGAFPSVRQSVVSTKAHGQAEESTHVLDGAIRSMQIPDDTLNADSFEWNVKLTLETGQVTPDAPNITVTTIDSLSTASTITPKNTYVNVDEAIFFDWIHTIATGTQQSKYELQGLLGGVWTTLQEEETSETSAVVPVDRLSSSITAWRVRTANNDGVYGEYSEPAQVIFIVAPQVTSVTVTGNVRPTIAWQAADQQGYEVMIDGNSTGVQYGTEKNLIWNELLEDGAHTVQVRVVNRFGLFSAWAEILHEVANVPQETAPMLSAALSGDADVQLMWSDIGGVERLIYRDGDLLDRAQSIGMYTDHAAYDEHIYRVRIVAEDGNYTDSNEVRIGVQMRKNMLAAVGEWEWIELAYSATAEPPVRTAALAPVYALNYYSGREKPVAEMSRHKSATYSVTYAVTEQQAKRLRGMMGKIVVHKRRGEMIRGLLQSVSEVRAWWGVDVTLQIAEVDED